MLIFRWQSSCSIPAAADRNTIRADPASGQQYEAVGHAVRATYFYSGMADIAAENARSPTTRAR